MNLAGSNTTPSSTSIKSQSRFVQITLIRLWLVTLVFVLLLITGNLYITRKALHDQASVQLKSTVARIAILFEQQTQLLNSKTSSLVNNPTFTDNFSLLLSEKKGSSTYNDARNGLLQLLQNNVPASQSDQEVQFSIIDASSKVLLSTDAQSEGTNIGDDSPVKPFLGQQITQITQNAGRNSENNLAIISSFPITDRNGEIKATLVGIDNSASKYLLDIVTSNPDYTPFISNDNLSGFALNNNQIVSQSFTPAVTNQLKTILQTGTKEGLFAYKGENGALSLAYGKWISSANAGLVVGIPQAVVFKQFNPIVLYSGIVFIITLLVFSAIFFFFTTAIINPLGILSKRISGFAPGEWSSKIPIWRNDEFGLIAGTFNNMAEQLNMFYHSMETKLLERTKHLRAASEIADFTVTSRELPELLKRTVNLLADRFGIIFVAIYLLNDSGSEIVLREASGEFGRSLMNKKFKVMIGPHSLVGWVAMKNLPKVIDDVSHDTTFTRLGIIPNARSEAGIPIVIGQQVLGVIDLQTPQEKIFTPEIIDVLMACANQLAIAIRNIRTSEVVRQNQLEVTTLNGALRQISKAASPTEVIEFAVQAFKQIPFKASLLWNNAGKLQILYIKGLNTEEPEHFKSGMFLPVSTNELNLTENKPTIIDDLNKVSAELSPIIPLIQKLECQSAALLPITSGQQQQGLILLGSPEPSYFSQSRLELFSNLTETVSSTLEKLDTSGQIDKRLAESQALIEINAMLAKENNLHKVFEVVHRAIQKAMGDVDFLVAIYDAKTKLIEIPYIFQGAETLALDPFPLGEGLTSMVIRNKQPLLISQDAEAQAKELGARITGKPAKSWLGVPLIAGDEIVGALIVQDAEKENRFTDDDIKILFNYSPQVATAIRSSLLLKNTQKLLNTLDLEKNLLNTLLENIPDKIYFKRKDGRYIRVSNAFARQFQKTDPAQLVGKTDFDLLAEDQASKIIREDLAILQSDRPVNNQMVQDSNSPQWNLISKIPVHDHQQQAYALLGISRDISDLINQKQSSNQRDVQLQTAAEIAREVSATFNLAELYQSVTQKIAERFGYSHVSIYIWDPVEKAGYIKEATGENAEKLKLENQAINESFRLLVGKALASREIQVVNNTANDPNYYPNPLLIETKSEIAIPLQVGERFMGLLDIHSKHPNAFTSEDISILRIIADQLAVTLVNSELFTRSQNNLVQHRLIHQITAAASASSNVDEALTSVIQSLQTTLPKSRISIFFINSERTELELRVFSGYEESELAGIKIRFGEGITGWVALNRRPLLINDTELDERFISANKKVRSELAVPIIYRDDLIGVLNLENDRPMYFDENDQEMMSTLAGSLAAIIANARLVDQIKQQVDRQQQLYEISSKIRRSTDVNTIIQTSATELAKILGARRAKIQITLGRSSENPIQPGGNGKNEESSQ